MTVDKDTVTYLSKLAKLNMPTGGEPEAVLALRDDVVKPSADKDELLANCAERTFFAPVVPKVVE